MATVEHQKNKQTEDIEFLWKWRKYLLLLATLVASVTYAAGLNPPGGVRSAEGGNNARGQHIGTVEHSRVYPNRVGGGVDPPVAPAVYPNRVGDPVLVSTYSRRYTAFFYCNAAAFVASLVVIMFLLDRRTSNNPAGLTVLRSAMLLDLLALMAAFAAGSCRDVAASIYVSVLFALVFAYVAIQVSMESKPGADSCPSPDAVAEDILKLKDRRKFMLLLAAFATPLTYGAGLVPPGGFWSQTEQGHRAGAPLLHDGLFKIRYDAFFYANATSFVASLAVIMMLMSRTVSDRLAESYALPVCVLVELLGLMAAFAAGSCRWVTTTVYVVCLVGVVLLYIVLQMAIAVFAMENFKTWHSKLCCILTQLEPAHTNLPPGNANAPQQGEGGGGGEEGGDSTRIIDIENGQAAEKVEESRTLLLLLATLAATVTYQAGMSPPGGVWPDEDDQAHLHHISGSPILQDMHPKRYMAFYHCNTAAFVASVVIIIIVQSKELSSPAVIRRAALKTAMILDLFGLMGAYVAGSCQDTASTIYVCVMAVAVVVYAIAKVVAYACKARVQTKPTNQNQQLGSDDLKTKLERNRKRKFLLQLAILAATVTYQSGLNPPGGFWQESKGERSLAAGDPVLLDYYGIRYQAFFYCNTTGFMASVAVILLLVNQMLYKQGIRSHALHVCVVVGQLGLMGAYAAGSSRQLRTSIYVFALVAAVVASLILQILFFVFANSSHLSEQPWLPQWLTVLVKPLSSFPGQAGENKAGKEVSEQHIEKHKKSKYLMLLGILAASVTYQAGLAPPGGTWGDDDDTASSLSPSPSPSPSAVAGNPILLDSSPARYQAFFYCNATSFVASIVVILLLLQHTLKKNKKRRVVPLWAVQTAVVLDLLGLLGAYAAGSCRGWETSAYVIALVAAVGVFITMYVLVSLGMKPALDKARKHNDDLGRSNDDG